MSKEALRQRALKLLAQRDHSRAELARKLAGLGSSQEIEEVLQRMAELELQSDRRFAEQFVRGRAGRFGASRLRRELRQRGIAAELCDHAMAHEMPEGEVERACRLWRSRFDGPAGDAREWARQARFLQYRGFSNEVIRCVLSRGDDEPA